MSDPNVAMAWCAIMISNHLLHYRDILFSDEGAVVVVKSTKSLQYLEQSLDKPLDGPLFYKRCGARLVPLLCRDVLKFLKDSVTLICIDPLDVGLHSFHCSSAAYLHCMGIPLIDIQCIGD